MISIIVPVYNVQDYVEDCLSSLLNQTDSSFEVVIVDDGSTDNSMVSVGRLIVQFEDGSIVRQDNRGLSEARNTGLEHAKYDFVMFLDSDDCLAPETISLLKRTIRVQNADLVAFSAKSFSSDRNKAELAKSSNVYRRNASKFLIPCSGPDYVELAIASNCYIKSACMYAFNRQLVPTLRFIPNILHEDNHFTAVISLSAQRMVVLDNQLYLRRIRQGSIMSSEISERNISGYYECAKDLNELSLNEADRKKQKLFGRLAADCYWQAFYSALKVKDRDVFKKWCILLSAESLLRLKMFWSSKYKLAFQFPRLFRLIVRLKSI